MPVSEGIQWSVHREVVMFTGIIEEVGKITRIEQRGENRRITIAAEGTPKELGTGNSVAVSGVC